MAKKLLSILVIATMVMSLFSVTVLAAETQKAEKVVFLQTFDGVTDSQVGAGTYAGGKRFNHGGAANSAIKYDNGNAYLRIKSNATNPAYDARAKIYIDQTKLEAGATYKISVKVTYFVAVGHEELPATTTLKAGVNTGTNAVGQSNNNWIELKSTTVDANVPAVIESKEFIYDTSKYDISDETKQLNALVLWRPQVKDDTIQHLKIDDVKLIKIVDANVADAEADAGYYAEAFDSEVKNGTIAFSSEIAQGIDDATGYGIWVYRADDNSKTETITVTDIESLKEAEGKFSVVVEDIPEAHFETGVCAKPFINFGDSTVWGNVKTFSVSEALKWLGNNK